MGYDLIPHNNELEPFYLGTFSFPVLLEACGYLFPCIQNGAKWYCVFGVDERMPKGHKYPTLISNDGFPITDDEAKIMARMARNFVAIQRSLPEQKIDDDEWLKPAALQIWPREIREDFTDKFEKFAEWAEKSEGFEIK